MIIRIRPEDADRFKKMIDKELEWIYSYRKKRLSELIEKNRDFITIKIEYKFPFFFKRIKRKMTSEEVVERAENRIKNKVGFYSDIHTDVDIVSNYKDICKETEASLRHLKKQLELGVDVYYDCSKHNIVFKNIKEEKPPFKNHDA